jgi:hypothetical protein
METITKRLANVIGFSALLFLFPYLSVHGQQQHADNNSKLSPLDIATIARVTTMKGKENKGEYKITVPQNDLQVVVDNFKIIPAMGLSSWAAFTPSLNGAMVMGDIILTENDLKPVQQEVIRQGLAITAIHNHFVRNHPNVMYMHIGGSGPTDQMAQKVKAVFDAVKTSRGHDPAAGTSDSVVTTINTNELDGIIGAKGEWSKGVYKYTIGRPDVILKEHGVLVSTYLGFNTWAAWQGTPDHAAVCGDFTMLEDEVAPVIKTLVQNGIEVVAVHNHMVHEQPRIVFLHYWGVGQASKLAQGLKAALNQTGKSPMMMNNH